MKEESMLRRKQRPNNDQLRQVAMSLQRWVAIGSHELDWSRLSDDEAATVVELHAKIREGEEPGITRSDPRHLGDRDRRRYERLVAKAFGRRDDLFEKAEEEAKMKTKLAELAYRVARPPARPKWEEQGAVVLRPLWVGPWVRDGVLFVEHIALLVIVLAQLEAGVAFAPRARIDRDALVINTTFGPIGADRTDVIWDWQPLLKHLAANRLLAIEPVGNEWRIRRGPRVLEIIEGRRAA
jgi:hypothetical protein